MDKDFVTITRWMCVTVIIVVAIVTQDFQYKKGWRDGREYAISKIVDNKDKTCEILCK